MDNNDNILIEKYLEKSLTAAEQQAFTERLTDPAFAHQVKLYKEALMAIYTLGDDRIKRLLQEDEASRVLPNNASEIPPQYSEAHAPLKVNWRKRLAIAASFLIVSSVGFWLFSSKKQRTPAALFASNFEAYKSFTFDPNARGKNEETNLTQVYRAYSTEKYSVFLNYFIKFNDLTKDELFLMANAYLGTGESEKAIPILLNVARDTKDERQQSAEWYLALAFLQQGNITECRAWLGGIIAQPNHPKKNQAQQLLNEMPQ